MKPKVEIFTTKVLAYATVMIISGSIASIALQFQKYYNYKHVIVILQEMFIGETLALFALVFPLIFSRKKQITYFFNFKNEYSLLVASQNLHSFFIGFGGFLDSIASCLEVLAVLSIPSSFYALMKNGVILFTAIFTVLLLKKPLYRHHWLSIFVILLGFTIIALGSIFSANQARLGKEGGETYVGVLLLTLSLVFASLQMVYQEYLFKNYALDAKRVVGNEGIFGTMVVSLALIFASQIECKFEEFCVKGKAFDSPSLAVSDMVSNPKIAVSAIVAIFSVMILNISGTSLTKMVSAVFRRMLDSLRTVLIWMLAWIIGLDQVDLWSFGIEFVGLAFLLLGNLIYNEIVEVSVFGFNKFVKRNSDV